MPPSMIVAQQQNLIENANTMHSLNYDHYTFWCSRFIVLNTPSVVVYSYTHTHTPSLWIIFVPFQYKPSFPINVLLSVSISIHPVPSHQTSHYFNILSYFQYLSRTFTSNKLLLLHTFILSVLIPYIHIKQATISTYFHVHSFSILFISLLFI